MASRTGRGSAARQLFADLRTFAVVLERRGDLKGDLPLEAVMAVALEAADVRWRSAKELAALARRLNDYLRSNGVALTTQNRASAIARFLSLTLVPELNSVADKHKRLQQ